MDLKFLAKYRDAGLLLLRAGIGIVYLVHGIPLLIGGPKVWSKLGGVMKHLGIDFFPEFWGFLAAFSEAFGGFFLIFGLFFRPACILLLITMVMATVSHVKSGDALPITSHALKMAIVFAGLVFVGPGKYSVDKE